MAKREEVMRERGCRWGGAMFSVGFSSLVREGLIWLGISRWAGWVGVVFPSVGGG